MSAIVALMGRTHQARAFDVVRRDLCSVSQVLMGYEYYGYDMV